MEQVTVVGAGLAGCEATWQLVKRNIPVRLIEMRPKKGKSSLSYRSICGTCVFEFTSIQCDE